MQTILNVVDHGMNAQEAVDAGRMHHQWLPDQIRYEKQMFSPDTLSILEAYGHRLSETEAQGAAEVIVVLRDEGVLEGAWTSAAPTAGPRSTTRIRPGTDSRNREGEALRCPQASASRRRCSPPH